MVGSAEYCILKRMVRKNNGHMKILWKVLVDRFNPLGKFMADSDGYPFPIIALGTVLRTAINIHRIESVTKEQ